MNFKEQKIEISYTPPTYSTLIFNEYGLPNVTFAEDEDAIAPLPSGWNDEFWDWQPRGDPNGQWVPLVEKYQNSIWSKAKLERDKAFNLGTEVSINGEIHTVNSDDKTANEIYRRQNRSNINKIKWTMADNQVVDVSTNNLRTMFEAIEDHRQAVHDWYKDIRVSIFGSDTLEKLTSINIEYGE